MGLGLIHQRGQRLKTAQQQLEEERRAGFLGPNELSQGGFTKAGPVGRDNSFGQLVEIKHDPTVNPEGFIPGNRSALELQQLLGSDRERARLRKTGGGGPGFAAGREGQAGLEKLIAFANPQVSPADRGLSTFLAGRGFSFQPSGFNLALSRFQEPDLFNFGNQKAGGFEVVTQKLTGRRKDRKTKTLLTGRIRRQKLDPGGSIRPREGALVVTQASTARTRAPRESLLGR